MSSREEKLAVLIKRIGNFDMSSFNGRVIFQKTAYLLQEFGITLGYNFNWYLRGPYSPQLTRDGGKLQEVAEIKLPTEEEKKFERFLDFLTAKDDSNWLETLASILFIKKISPSRNKEEIAMELKKHQQHLTKEIFERAWSYLVKHKLLIGAR